MLHREEEQQRGSLMNAFMGQKAEFIMYSGLDWQTVEWFQKRRDMVVFKLPWQFWMCRGLCRCCLRSWRGGRYSNLKETKAWTNFSAWERERQSLRRKETWQRRRIWVSNESCESNLPPKFVTRRTGSRCDLKHRSCWGQVIRFNVSCQWWWLHLCC